MPAALPASSVRLAFVLAMPPRIANYLANPPTNPPKPWTRTGMTQYVDNDKCVDYVDLNTIVARRRSGKPNPSPIPSLASQAAPSSTPPTPASTGNVAPSPSPSLQRAIHRLYHDTVALAPMVRAGTLPLRLLALQYGCNVVYGEEIIDRKLMQCIREENRALGTIDFVTKSSSSGSKGEGITELRRLVFQTVAREKECVIFQMGTRNPEWAVQAAKVIEHDVAAIDLNMGCPKKFSLQDGMGAALLDNPQTASSLITALRLACPHLPISCKIRLLDTDLPLPKTIAFAKAMEAAGACALNVHMRTKEDKQSDPARWELLRPVVDAVQIPVVANGDLYTREDVERMRAMSGCAAVMLARPVLYNPSVLRTLRCGTTKDGGKEGATVHEVTTISSSSALSSPVSSRLLPLIEVIRAYLRVCLRYESHVSNAKYVVLEMIVRRRHPDHVKPVLLPLDVSEGINVNTVSRTKTLHALAELFGVVAEKGEGKRMDAGSIGIEGLHHYADDYFGSAKVEQGGVVVAKRREGGKECAGAECLCSKRQKVREEFKADSVAQITSAGAQ